MVWIYNYIHSNIRGVITHPCPNFIVSVFHVAVITYPCPILMLLERHQKNWYMIWVIYSNSKSKNKRTCLKLYRHRIKLILHWILWRSYFRLCFLPLDRARWTILPKFYLLKCDRCIILHRERILSHNAKHKFFLYFWTEIKLQKYNTSSYDIRPNCLMKYDYLHGSIMYTLCSTPWRVKGHTHSVIYTVHLYIGDKSITKKPTTGRSCRSWNPINFQLDW